MFGAFHYSVAIRNGVLHLWFRFGAHFARGSLPGSFIDFNRAKPPLLTFAQLRRGEGFTAPPDVVCSAGISADEALTRAKRAALRSANIMAMRCSSCPPPTAGTPALKTMSGMPRSRVWPLYPTSRKRRAGIARPPNRAIRRLRTVLPTCLWQRARPVVPWIWRRQNAGPSARMPFVKHGRAFARPPSSTACTQVDQAISRDPEVQLSKAVAGAVTGTTVRYTPRPPFEVKVVDTPVHYGQFLVDP